MKPLDLNPGTPWQMIFEGAKVNGGTYDGDKLPQGTWQWPKNGFLTLRLAEIRAGKDRESE